MLSRCLSKRSVPKMDHALQRTAWWHNWNADTIEDGTKTFIILIHCNLIVTRAINFCSDSVRHCNSGGTSPNHIKLASDNPRSLLLLSLSWHFSQIAAQPLDKSIAFQHSSILLMTALLSLELISNCRIGSTWIFAFFRVPKQYYLPVIWT